MMPPIRIALVGDYNPDVAAHKAIPLAIDDAAVVLELPVEQHWLATRDITADSVLADYDAIWVVPASPYQNTAGALRAIHYARENAIPFLGTCGGFQHALLEFARNVMGIDDAAHAEVDSSGTMIITPLSCSLTGEGHRIELRPNTLLGRAWGRDEITQAYSCSYGVQEDFARKLAHTALKVSAWDEDGEVRGVELSGHPFFVATLFQPERAALDGHPVPLVHALLRAAKAH